jgi:integrase
MNKLQYVQSFDGYNYLRYKKQARVRLPDGKPSGPAFMAAYKAALAAAQAADNPTPPTPRRKKKLATGAGTIRDAVTSYMGSHTFQKLEPATKAARRYLLDGWVRKYGDEAFGELTRKALAGMLYLRAGTPGAARNWLVAVRAMVADRIAAGEIEEDPTLGLKAPPSTNPDGYPTWEPEHLEAYREYWPSGTPQRLAIEMLYGTGAACCDAIRLTRRNIVGGLVEFSRQKTGEASFPALTPELADEITACGLDETVGVLLRTEQGLPFHNAHYFSAQVAKWARLAGVPAGFGAHGIRKAAATADAEAGWTTTELKSKYGWSTHEQPDHYTKNADRRRIALARAAQIRPRTVA